MGIGLQSFKVRMKRMREAPAEAMPRALVKGGDIIADTMRLLAPVDTGDLISSIAVTGPGQQTPPYSLPGGSMVVPLNAVAVTAGNTDVRYPHLLEYGTSDTPAQPFFFPGYRLAKKRAAATIRREISKAIKATAK